MMTHLVFLCQMLNLNDGELEWLSNHLGHSVNVHKDFYRNQEAGVELGMVAKMLIAVDNGQTLTCDEKQGIFM